MEIVLSEKEVRWNTFLFLVFTLERPVLDGG